MGYRLLNGHLNPRIQCVPLRNDEEPELVYIKVQEGMEFAFDPNSMALLQIDGVKDFLQLRSNPPNPYIMARYKPNFQRAAGAPSNIGSLVLEACHDCNLACSYPLSGDTLVPLLDGRTLRLHDIPEDEDTWVYSTHEGRVIPVLARRVLSSPKARRVKIRIQDRDGNIKAITGEPTHDMMLSDGSVRELGQLSPGDSLMPFYRELGSLEMDERLSGYERVQDPGTGDWCWTHRRLAETCDIAGLVFADNEYEICENPDIREVVHHYSGEAGNIFNKRNNRPDCLFWMSWANHSALHAYACFQSNEFWTEERRKRMADFQRERRNRDWQNPEYRARQLEVRRKNWQNGVGDAVNEGRDKANADPNHRRRVNKSISEGHLNAAPKVQRAKKSRMSLVGNLRAMKSRGEIPQSMTFGELEGLAIHIEPYKTYKSGIVEGNPCSFIEFAESRESHKPQPAAVNGNHVVLSVEKVEPGPVHCLICDHESHNFAVIGEPDVEYEYDAVRGATIDNEPVAFSGVFTFQCFVRNYYADHGTGNYMTFDTARTAIDRLLDPKKRLSVGFFGGEPMLNMKLIKEVTAYVEDLAKKFSPRCKRCGGSGYRDGEDCIGCRGMGCNPPSFHVTTNGTLYTEENLRFLRDHGYSLITSIDGTSEAHDALRPMKRSGKGSHKQIVAGLMRMKQVAPELTKKNTLRSTFSAMRGETIRERLEFLNQICDDGMGSWVSVEPAAMSENTCFIPNQDELEIHVGNVWDRFHGEYMDTADWWIERAKANKQPRFHNIHKSLERIFWTVHSGTECGAGAGYAAVNAKGEIFGCHRESNSYLGTLVTGIDPKLRQPWLDNRIYTRTGCMNCGHRFACGGGCREDSLGDKGNIHEPSNVHCALKELWIRSALKVMATLPKSTIAKFCAEPGGERPRKLHQFISADHLERDESGIIKQKWVDNIPMLALVREGIEPTQDVPVFQDAPTDSYVVDTMFNPAGPVEIDPAVSTALR